MKVYWTNTAIGPLTDIYEYIAGNSQRYAHRMVDRITGRSIQLATFPESGQIVLEYGDPSIPKVIEGSYRVIYQIQANHIDVLAVIHTARQLPRTLKTLSLA
ncbi:Plasmid stabilization system protein [Anatilimnocola aggregata]|uniref:Plasmid stabilization system protein n=1 Tax=Anatilimnocola aggregata TaxID=2528021 RepID=A0A517YB48_9BACT|nr:type II toxin-antitoxin system RelE/ParE family toxin [Anatilimnocola aggregata]QDU27486.1 Plasmid stabilization system protein [Anatilimnocola aggregata]